MLNYFSASQNLTGFFTAGYTSKINTNFDLQSSLLIITDERNTLGINFDLNNTLVYKDKAKVGISFRDPSIYNDTMANKYASRKDIPDKHSMHFTNFAVNAAYEFKKANVGFAFNFQDYTKMNLSDETGWKMNAMEVFMKIRI